MPTEDGVRRHNRRHLRQDATSETHAENGQPTPFVVGELQSPALQLRLQDSVLVSEVLDRLLILASQPAEENRHDQLQRDHQASLRQVTGGRIFGQYGIGNHLEVTSARSTPG